MSYRQLILAGGIATSTMQYRFAAEDPPWEGAVSHAGFKTQSCRCTFRGEAFLDAVHALMMLAVFCLNLWQMGHRYHRGIFDCMNDLSQPWNHFPAHAPARNKNIICMHGCSFLICTDVMPIYSWVFGQALQEAYRKRRNGCRPLSVSKMPAAWSYFFPSRQLQAYFQPTRKNC